MASTISPATVTATATSLLALTTPFAPPPGCSEIFSKTNTVTSFSWNNFSETTLQIWVSDPSDPRFTGCQPPGWDDVVSKSRFSFSPAVCPSEWTAYNVQATSSTSTAYCCASGYSLDELYLTSLTDIKGISQNPCFGEVNPDPTTTASFDQGPTTHYPHGVKMHNPYHISWQASDVPTLTPSPPNLPSCAWLETWVPGDKVYDCQSSNSDGNDLGSGYNLIWLGIIGAPLLVVAIAGTIGGCCCYHIAKERRQKAEQAYRQQQLQQSQSLQEPQQQQQPQQPQESPD